MNQALYAHMNNKRKKKGQKILECWGKRGGGSIHNTAVGGGQLWERTQVLSTRNPWVFSYSQVGLQGERLKGGNRMCLCLEAVRVTLLAGSLRQSWGD
jgi:hypothetical protein